MLSSVQRLPGNGISVLISGSGIGGLMTAIECWRVGCSVRILERTASSSTAGDSFTIGASAITQCFKHYPEMQARCNEIGYNPLFELHKTNGEKVQGPFEFTDMIATGSKAKVADFHRHLRPRFHAMLLEQLEKSGLSVEYGNEVVEYSESESKGAVVLRSGERVEADLVVAADGLRTESWNLIAGKPMPARSSGNAAFRVAYDAAIAKADPEIWEHFRPIEEGRSVMQMWFGPEGQASFWLNDEKMVWSIVHPDSDPTAEESWSNHVPIFEALKLTAKITDWPEYADRVIKATPNAQVVDFKLMWRDPQEKWTSPLGRVVQLGDAAHTFLPSSGNGGTQALEDAISLAACLTKAGEKRNIPQAVRVHNLLRFQRVSCLQAFGVLNRETRKDSSKTKDMSKLKPTLGKWLVEHDPAVYARERYEEATRAVEAGQSPGDGEGMFKNTNIPPRLVYKPWNIDGLVTALDKGQISGTVLDGDWSG